MISAREDVNAVCVKLLKYGRGNRNNGRSLNREDLKMVIAVKEELRNPTGSTN